MSNSKKHLIVKKLDGSNLQDVMGLQQKIIAGLHPDEQHFILHRTAADYMKSLNGKGSHMLGVFDGKELIAQIVYETPQNDDERSMPEFKSDMKNSQLVVYEAILVDPAYRGSGLMKKMLDYIEAYEIDECRTHSVIQIAVDNPASWINALHHGMSITKVDFDPYDGCKVIYLEKEISKADLPFDGFVQDKQVYDMYLGNNIHQKIPALFSKMQHLIGKGYVGVKLDKEKSSLIWEKTDGNMREMSYIHALKQYKIAGIV